MILKGTLVSGMGTAKMWVKMVEKVFKEKTNIKLYNGTLNIKLEDNYTIKPDFIILPHEFGGNQNVLVKKCKLLGVEAYAIRAEKNQIGTGDYDLTILEIVSNVNFRDTYNLKDNQELIIEI